MQPLAVILVATTLKSFKEHVSRVHTYLYLSKHSATTVTDMPF